MTDTARLFYLLATDDDPVPRIASFGSMFPDGVEPGTTSEEVARLDVAHVHHAGSWAVVRCDLAILDAARLVDPLASGDDATLAAAYLSSRDAGRERQLVAAAIRQLGGAGAALESLRSDREFTREIHGTFVKPAPGPFVGHSPRFSEEASAPLVIVGGTITKDRHGAREGKQATPEDYATPGALVIDDPVRWGVTAVAAAESRLAQLWATVAGAAPGHVSIGVLDDAGETFAVLAAVGGGRWRGRVWPSVQGRRSAYALRFARTRHRRPEMVLELAAHPFRHSEPDAVTACVVLVEDIGLRAKISEVGATDVIDLEIRLDVDGRTWPPAERGPIERYPVPAWTSGDFAIGDRLSTGYVGIASFAPSAGATELHHTREATADDTTCCRCTDPILVGEMIHTATVTAADGTVTHRQATHLRHLRA